MEVGDVVSVLDDGKHNRKVKGKVVAVVDDSTVVVSHILWGYGEDQLPVNYLYRKDCTHRGWVGLNECYKNSEGIFIELYSTGYEGSTLDV